MFKNLKVTLVTLVLALGLGAGQAQAIPVDLELSLLVDVSGSINATEFDLQRTGYVNAFNNASIVTAIGQGSIGAIAVNLIYWSSGNEQQQAVGWTLINDTSSANAFATAIGNATRPFNDNTGPGSAINFARPLFSNGFEGTRLVMDVSGDGEQNSGADTSDARDAAAAAGITINGLVIGNASLKTWYEQNVKTTDGFVDQAADFNAFGIAINKKLVTEIGQEPGDPNPVPEPSSMLLLSSGIMGLFRLRKKVS